MNNTSISKTSNKPRSVANFLDTPNVSKYLERTLREKKGEFISNLITIANNDANIAKCDPSDLMKSALNATALNLPLNPNLGYAYIIAYKNNRAGKYEPSFQIGYKGLIQLAIRTGSYKYLNATEVREGEISRNKITGEISFIKENPDGPVVGYMAYLELISGFSASLYMSEDDIEKHALKFSKMYAYDKQNHTMKSKWSDPDSRPKMAIKTVLKSLLGTYGLMTTEFAKAFDADNDHIEPETSSNGRNIEDAEVIPQGEPEPAPKQNEEPEQIKL